MLYYPIERLLEYLFPNIAAVDLEQAAKFAGVGLSAANLALLVPLCALVLLADKLRQANNKTEQSGERTATIFWSARRSVLTSALVYAPGYLVIFFGGAAYDGPEVEFPALAWSAVNLAWGSLGLFVVVVGLSALLTRRQMPTEPKPGVGAALFGAYRALAPAAVVVLFFVMLGFCLSALNAAAGMVG